MSFASKTLHGIKHYTTVGIMLASCILLCCVFLSPARASASPDSYAVLSNNAGSNSNTDLFIKAYDSPFSLMNTQALTSVLLTEGDTYTLQSAITYDAQHTDYVSHVWTLSDNEGSRWEDLDTNAREYTIENAQKGDYLYKMTAQDAIGNSATETFQVTVQEKPVTPAVSTNEATKTTGENASDAVLTESGEPASEDKTEAETSSDHIAEPLLAKTSDNALRLGVAALIAALGAAGVLVHSKVCLAKRITTQRRRAIRNRFFTHN